MTLTVLDLFSGIGGFSLGLESVGMRTIAFCEIDPYCRAVLRKHWPNVPIYKDVRTLPRIDADVICGGFPCQDISIAGKGAGIDGERSGLWSEFARIIGDVRPRYAIVENVSALLNRGLERVLGDLAALRYDAEWHCIPASAVGAPHLRDRIWIITYPQHSDSDESGLHRAGMHEYRGTELRNEQISKFKPMGEAMANANIERLEKREGQDAGGARPYIRPLLERGERWLAEPDVCRVAHGIPSRVDRLKALGNAVVPQIPEIIGRAIMQAEGLTEQKKIPILTI